MSHRIRIASFNFENFFSRAILLNRDNASMAPQLVRLAQLQEELAKEVYDKGSIVSLYESLREHVLLRENRGLLLSNGEVVAGGRADWDGFLEPKRERLTGTAQKNTVRVLEAVDADVVCAVEMEDRQTLRAAGRTSRLPAARRYAHAMLIEGNDERGIDVGVLSRHPIRRLESHVDDEDEVGEVFSRDCLEVELLLPGRRKLYLLANHLKSQGYGSRASNDAKRLRQARRIAEILAENYDLEEDLVVVAGDMNADRTSASAASLAPLTDLDDLVDVFDDADDNWSYAYRGKKQRLDYLFCSRPLARRLESVGVERRGMWDLLELTGGKEHPFPGVDGATSAASDHAAVYADFKLG